MFFHCTLQSRIGPVHVKCQRAALGIRHRAQVFHQFDRRATAGESVLGPDVQCPNNVLVPPVADASGDMTLSLADVERLDREEVALHWPGRAQPLRERQASNVGIIGGR